MKLFPKLFLSSLIMLGGMETTLAQHILTTFDHSGEVSDLYNSVSSLPIADGGSSGHHELIMPHGPSTLRLHSQLEDQIIDLNNLIPSPANQSYNVLMLGPDVSISGYRELLVGNPYTGSSFSGRVDRIVYDATLSPPLQHLDMLPGIVGQTFFGVEMIHLGDVDKDGGPDIAVSAPGHPNSAIGMTGAVQVISLAKYASTGGNTGVIAELYGQSPNIRFGASLANLGDVNGDGTNDLAVGAPGIGVDFMPVYIQVFSGKDWTPIYTVDGVNKTRFGNHIATVDDIDNDTIADWVTGPYYDDNLGKYVSSFHSGQTGQLLFTVDAPLSTLIDESYLDAIGDIDRDGYKDVVIAYHEIDTSTSVDIYSIEVVSGQDGSVICDYEDTPSSAFILRATKAGDYDSDGHPDIAVLHRDPVNSQSYTRIITCNEPSLTVFTGVGTGNVTESTVSVISGGSQTMIFDTGAKHAGKSYQLIGSTGAIPGQTLDDLYLPLNDDSNGLNYFTLSQSLAPVLMTNGTGTLGAGASTVIGFNFPPISDPVLLSYLLLNDINFYHAVVVYDSNGKAEFISNPVKLNLQL